MMISLDIYILIVRADYLTSICMFSHLVMSTLLFLPPQATRDLDGRDGYHAALGRTGRGHVRRRALDAAPDLGLVAIGVARRAHGCHGQRVCY